MAAGDLTATLIGTYRTMALAIAAADAATLTLATDFINIVSGANGMEFHVYKIERAAA